MPIDPPDLNYSFFEALDQEEYQILMQPIEEVDKKDSVIFKAFEAFLL